MAANPAYMHGHDAADAQPRQGRRSWASTVPYDLLDSGEVVDMRPAPPSRPRSSAAAAPNQAGSTITYRPVRATTNLEPEDVWRPVAGGSATSRLREEAQPSLLARSSGRLALYVALAAVAVVVLYVVVSSVVHWTQIRMDDMAYGRPRTTHLDAVVGNGDSAAQPTHFIAINLNRQVSVIEIPGGDISKAVAISGPYLFGEEEDLTPVKLDVTDLNGDGKPDLLVDVKSEQLAYINDGATFRPITDQEKAQVEQQAAQPAAAGGH